jgi:hypothetical protein
MKINNVLNRYIPYTEDLNGVYKHVVGHMKRHVYDRERNMIISQEDKNESVKIIQLIKKVDNIDEAYVNSESEIISQKQPFLISLLLGYRFD